MAWLLTALAAWGLWGVLAGGLTIGYALWLLLRLPFDLSRRHDRDD